MEQWRKRIVVVAVGLFLGGNVLMMNAAQASPIANLAPPVKTVSAEVRDAYVVQSVKQVSPAVVGITPRAYVLDNFSQKVLVDQGRGSGVIFSPDGYIVTNAHVVKGAQAVTVLLDDGRSLSGKIIGADPVTDLAVVKVDAAELPTATFGDSDSLVVGEPAIAIGDPLYLRDSVTVGVISALNRTLDNGDFKNNVLYNVLQTDAAINPGNSGGALVDADGQVIGINVSKLVDVGVKKLGFAIPINSARPILQSLVEKGKVVRASLGINGLDQDSAHYYGIDHGVYVIKAPKDGSAYEAGIRGGDIIEKINTKAVNSVADLRAVLDTVPVGSSASVTINRNGQALVLHLVLKEMLN